MKNKYLFKLFLLAIPLVSLVFMSTSIGVYGAYSGSPGDGNSCAFCHSGGNFDASLAITTNIPVTGYEFDTPYDITVTLNETGATDHGFALTAERDEDNAKVGTFTPVEGITKINNVGNITQSFDTNGNTWSFTWTSPSTNLGPITFYAAGNAANGNAQSSGDQIVTTSLPTSPTTLGITETEKLEFKMFPNPSTDILNIQLSVETLKAEVGVYDHTGRKIIVKKLSPEDSKLNVSKLSTGIYIIRVLSDNKVGVQTLIKS